MPDKLTIGVTDLSFHRVTASLITHILKDMGFIVERVYAQHEDNFKQLKIGKTDLLASAWLPSSHGEYKSAVEKVIPIIELGLHYKPYALWGVPDYIPVEVITQISDLLNPEVINKMMCSIQGINPGAGISRFSIQMMHKYGLSKAGYQFFTGTEDDCFKTFEQSVKQKKWLIVPLWKPQFLHHQYTIRELIEPKGLLGTVDRAVLLLRADKQHLFSIEQLQQLDNLRFSNEIIAQLDHQVCRENQPIDTVTKTWLEENFNAFKVLTGYDLTT